MIMNEALEYYKNKDEVMNINGYCFPIESKNLPDTFFLRQISSWGWGTWKRSWKKINFDNDLIKSKFNKKLIRKFNLNNSYNFWSHFMINYNKIKSTWAIYWYLAIFLNNGLSLFPKKTLIINNGFDGSGENCDIDNSYKVTMPESINLNLGNVFEVNKEAEDQLILFYKSIKKSILKKILYRIGFK